MWLEAMCKNSQLLLAILQALKDLRIQVNKNG